MLFISAMESALSASVKQHSLQPAIQQSDEEISTDVESLLQEMSLVDKVGEMTQLTIDMISAGEPYNVSEPHQLDEAKLKEALLDLRVGSILNVGGHAYTLKHWRKIIRKIQEIAVDEKPTGIPVLYGIDTIHGANYTMGSTLFPQQIGLAATWNPDMAKICARIGAYETRASHIPWAFSPVLDVGRDARWPRLWETFGEDVHLNEQMGVAMTEGYQGESVSDPHRVAATMKHYMGYSMPVTGKDRTQAWIPERQLREYFLPPFQAAVDAGALTVMINSGEVNGVPVHISKHILTDILRGELGFKGPAVTDWEDIQYLYTRHKVAKDYKEAIKLAINAGVDMSMVPTDTEFPTLLRELVEEGQVPLSRINEAVRRILTVKHKLGLFDRPCGPEDNDSYHKFGSEDFAHASREAAAESITLLKNEDATLPLSYDQNILITGPAADSLTMLNGGWSRTWQGDDQQFDDDQKHTLVDALCEKVCKEQVTFIPGTTTDTVIDIPKAVTVAEHADVAVICVGESPYTETPGDLNDLWLPEAQRSLVKRIAETDTPIVLVLIQGRPRIIRDIEPLADAILLGYLPSENGSDSIADILFGDVNPSGKLPYTYPRHPNDLTTYDHKYTDVIKGEAFNVRKEEAFNPQWAFGFGLSYTSFEYRNLMVDQKNFGPGDKLNISVEVTNTGTRSGQEVTQLYVSDHVASITPPVRRLRGFKKVMLDPGETKQITFTISASDLSFVGRNNRWVTEPGDFTVQVGPLKYQITYKE